MNGITETLAIIKKQYYSLLSASTLSYTYHVNQVISRFVATEIVRPWFTAAMDGMEARFAAAINGMEARLKAKIFNSVATPLQIRQLAGRSLSNGLSRNISCANVLESGTW